MDDIAIDISSLSRKIGNDLFDLPEELIHIILEYVCSSLYDLYCLQLIDSHWRRVCHKSRLWLTADDVILLPSRYLLAAFSDLATVGVSQAGLTWKHYLQMSELSITPPRIRELLIREYLTKQPPQSQWSPNTVASLRLNRWITDYPAQGGLEYLTDLGIDVEAIFRQLNLSPADIAAEYSKKRIQMYEFYEWYCNWLPTVTAMNDFLQLNDQRIANAIAGMVFSLCCVMEGLLLTIRYSSLSNSGRAALYHTVLGLFECCIVLVTLIPLKMTVEVVLKSLDVRRSFDYPAFCDVFSVVLYGISVLVLTLQCHVQLSPSFASFPIDTLTMTLPSWSCLVIALVSLLFCSGKVTFYGYYDCIISKQSKSASSFSCSCSCIAFPVYPNFAISSMYLLFCIPVMITATIVLYHLQYTPPFDISYAIIPLYPTILVLLLLAVERIWIAMIRVCIESTAQSQLDLGLGAFITGSCILTAIGLSLYVIYGSREYDMLPLTVIGLLGGTAIAFIGLSIDYSNIDD